MASKIQGITVEIGGDTTKLGNALKSVNSQSKSLQTELKGVNSLLKMDPSNVTLLKQKQDLLNQSIANTKEKLNTLKTAQIQVQEQFDKGQITEEQYRDFQREIIATENKLKSLENEAKSFGSVGAQKVAVVGEKMQELGGKVEAVGKKFSVISAGIVAVGAASVAAFKEVDEGADIAVKATGAVGEQAKEIRESYSNVASSIKGEFTDIGAALGEVNTRFGFTGEVTGADVTNAVQKVSRYMGDASIDSSQYSKVLDNLTVACQASGISMDSLTETLVSYGAPMRALGFETEESIAIFSQWEKAGVNTSIAFSGMKTAISKWSAEGKDAREEFKKTLAEIKNCPDIASATTKAIEAFGKKAGPDLADAIKGGRFEYEDFLTLLQNSEGQLDGTYNEVIDGADDAKLAMQNMKLALSEIGNTIMTMLSPIIQSVSEHIKSFAEKWKSLSPEVQKVIVIIGGLVAAIGPVLIIIGKLMSSVGAIMTYGPKLVTMFGTVKTALSGLFTFIAANPIILVITAIIAAVILLWNKCEWFRNLVMAMFEAIKQVVSVVWNAIVQYFQQAWANIQAVWAVVQPYFMALWEGIKQVFSVVASVLGTFFTNAWNVIKGIWDFVYPYFQMLWENIKVVFSVVSTVLGGFFQTAWTVIKAVWDTVSSYFSAVWETIKGIFSVVSAVFHGDFSGAWEAIKGIINTWASYFQNIWNNIKNIFASVGSFFSNSFQAAWNGIKSIFSNVGSFFQGIWNTIKNMFTSIGTTIGDAIGGAFRNVVNSIISFAENTINGFIRSINWAIDVINNIPGVNIPRLNELNIPRLKVGMANVPYDDYLALLHKGERVLTAEENKEYSSGTNDQISNNNIDNSFNVTINSPEATSPAENARLVRREIQKYKILHA